MKIIKGAATFIGVLVMILVVIAMMSPAEEAKPLVASPAAATQPKPADTTVDENVLVNKNGINITLKSLNTKGLLGPELVLLIENDSKNNITVQARDSHVNGAMVDTIMSADVAAGKKSTAGLKFSSSDLKRSGITTYNEFGFYLHIIDDNWNTLFDTDPILVHTSNDSSVKQSFDDSGSVLFEEKGFKVVAKDVDEKGFLGPKLNLYIENNSAKDVTFQVRDVSVNGYMINTIFSSDVLSGKVAFDDITIMKSDMEKNNLTKISDMELYFHIFESKSWNTILDTDIITITFE